jgi:hypothetical protein
MAAKTVYVLIHSPLVGPLTWAPVAEEMRAHGLRVSVPTLMDSPDSSEPFWKQHADSVGQTLAWLPNDAPVALVAHSGAGPLLPAIRQSLPNPIQAYVFVDAGIPRTGTTRLELMKSEDREWAGQFQEYLEGGGRFPDWSNDDLRELIPDDHLRKQMVAEIQPRSLEFFSEPIPVFEGWPDAPCVYIQFSAPYERPAALARQQGWIAEEIPAGHFHMLVDPNAVASKIVETVGRCLSG